MKRAPASIPHRPRQAQVFNNGILVGTLRKELAGYVFQYDDRYFLNPAQHPISVTLPKSRQLHRAASLFPFFCGLLSEGANRQMQSRLLRVDEQDHFGLLLATTTDDTIGSVTVQEVQE
ncbi:MAG: HipA N-terminal domain-containing protein [Bacteroidota bacterium]